MLAALADALVWIVGISLSVALRFELDMSQAVWLATLVLAVGAGCLQILLGFVTKLYRGRYSYGSFDEVRLLALITLSLTLTLGLIVVAVGRDFGLPRSTVFLAAPFVLVMMFGVRYLSRLLLESRRKPGDDAEPALVLGAGHVGDRLLADVTTDPNSPIRAVGLLDDDPAKKNLVLRGVPVIGRTRHLERAVRDTGATVVIVAIAAADSAMLRKISDQAAKVGARVVVTPSLHALLSGKASPADLRDISIEDLIGRHTVDTNVEQIAGYITGKRVLVTGAGGSIGSELCRQLSKFGPSALVMLDRDETGLQLAQLGTAGHGLLDSDDLVLADIREPDRIDAVFHEHQPEVVFHAAALKHLPMLEQYPDEAWKTNVLGTRNVLEAARSVGVATFVNISTDKAANPTSVLGHSKRVAEKLTAWAAEASGMRYLSVRFGNVIGSRGSMLPTFQSLIHEGKPLTVTHPEATRYFMTIPEACQLVIQAGGIGRPGEVLILDMGEPVSILDVAQRMIAMSGKTLEIVFTGLRPGEKLHEQLVGAGEHLERPFHPKISHTTIGKISPDRLVKAEWSARMVAVPQQSPEVSSTA